MGILQNYREYRENKPQYKKWEKQRETEEAKRIDYLKKNNITPDKYKADIERAKTILNAVDVMDEFSQSRAEEMEMTVKAAQNGIMQVANYGGMALALLKSRSNK